MAITTPSDFARIEKTTIGEQIKGEEINIVRNQKTLALLEAAGRITFNHSGKRMEFDIRKGRNTLQPYSDGASLDFPRVNRWEDAALPWRAYTAAESVGWLEKLKCQGPEARVNFVAEIAEALTDDVRFNFGSKFYIDGNASGYTDEIHGWKSFLAYSGAAQYLVSDDTYAGVATLLGSLGGAAISGTYPDGQFDPEYNAWTPLLFNYTDSAWSTATDTFVNNALEVLGAVIVFQNNLRGKQMGQLDLILLTASLYNDLLALSRTKERIVVARGESSKLVSLGFRDVINIDGVDVTYDADVPSTEIYGFSTKAMELKSMQPQLFVPNEDFDLDYIADRYAITFAGNLQCNPIGFIFGDDAG